MTNVFDIEKINETVWIFKNAIKNPAQMVEHFEKNKKWEDWPMFGKQALGHSFLPTRFNEFPTEEKWDIFLNTVKSNINNSIDMQVDQLFHKVTSLYAKEQKIYFDNWLYRPWSIAKYDETTSPNYAMMHHTDYQRDSAYSPEEKFGITVIFYLNDDYDGGEISFKFLDNDDFSIVKEEYTYKPKAGDVVVFTSGHPNYHAVKSVSGANKYIIRVYWRYEYSGHPLWHSLNDKYGKDTWSYMENERTKIANNQKGVKLIHDIPFWTSLEEYYKDEIGKL